MAYMWQDYIRPQNPLRLSNRLPDHLKRSFISNVNVGMTWVVINEGGPSVVECMMEWEWI